MSTPPDILKDFALQAKLQRLIEAAPYSTRVRLRNLAKCNSYPIFANRTEVGVDVFTHANGEKSARFIGLGLCKSAWACPHCMAIRLAEYREKITQLINFHGERGYTAHMVTFTIPHYQQQSAAEVLHNLKSSWKQFMTTSTWLRRKFGILGIIVANECKYSDFNGWHFHIHALFFIKAEHSSEFISDSNEARLTERWKSIIKPLYLHTPTGGSTCVYITKRPVTDGAYIAKELSKRSSSKATKAHRGAQWDTLELLESNDPRRNMLYLEYAAAVYKHNRIRIGAGLLKGFFFDWNNRQYNQDNPYEVISVETVAAWTFTEWYDIQERQLNSKHEHKLNILRAAIDSGFDGVFSYCYDHGLPLPHEPTAKSVLTGSDAGEELEAPILVNGAC